jgi:hypothetical protein
MDDPASRIPGQLVRSPNAPSTLPASSLARISKADPVAMNLAPSYALDLPESLPEYAHDAPGDRRRVPG